MLDSLDLSDSTLRRVLWEALDHYDTAELLAFCRDPDTILRTSAAKKLHIRPDRGVFESACEFCLDSDSTTREIGCFILGQLGTPKKPFGSESLNWLELLANDRCSDVRAAAIAALGHLSIPSSIGAIIGAAKDDAREVRLSAAFALGGFAGNEVIEVLNALILDEDAEVREWAEIGLETAGEH